MLEKLKNDIITSMKNKDRFRLTTLREIKGPMDLEHINRKVPLTDELLIEVVTKQIKLRKESLKEFEKAERNDLIEKINKELSILSEYLPAQITEEEVLKIIEEAFVKISPKALSDMGLIMREVTPLVKGKADMAKVSALIKEKLSSL